MANAAPFCVTVCVRMRMYVCVSAHPDLVVQTILIYWLSVFFFFLLGLLHSFLSSECPAVEASGMGRPSACCESAVPLLISSRFISLGHNQIKTLTHLLSTIYKCLPGAWESLAGAMPPLLGLLGRCPVVSPPSLGNLTISGQLMLYDLPRRSVELFLLACISLTS